MEKKKTTRIPAARAASITSGGMKNAEMSSSTSGRHMNSAAGRPLTASRIARPASSNAG